MDRHRGRGRGPLARPLPTGLPKPDQALEILFGSRGILLFTPVVAAGIWGLWRLARRAGPLRDDARLGLAVLLGFFLLLPTLFTMALGAAGSVVHLLLIALAVWRLEAALARSPDTAPEPAR